MATLVKYIEKEFLLKVLYDEKLPVICHRDGAEYTLYMEKPVRDDMTFRVDRPIDKLKAKDRLDLLFDYRSKVVVFNVTVQYCRGMELVTTIPDFLYKNLDRSYSRVSIPPQMSVQLTLLGDRYNLSFPKVTEYDAGDLGDFFLNNDLKNLSGLVEQMAAWTKSYASGYRLMIFKDVKPSTTEERIITETGKALYLQSTRDAFPREDPYPRKRIITEEIFKRYLESTGIGQAFVGNACSRFIRAKADNGILSDAWMPILFHEYVIGYIHLWNSVPGNRPFDYAMLDTLYQFAKVLAHSLKVNGYFEKGKVKNDTFEGKVIDISASGLLFAYPHSDLSAVLLPESKLIVKIITPEHTITSEAVIVRRFKDKTLEYYGCRFTKMQPEDLHVFFEYIYGKSLTDNDITFLTGQV